MGSLDTGCCGACCTGVALTNAGGNFMGGVTGGIEVEGVGLAEGTPLSFFDHQSLLIVFTFFFV
jgi:hypothetical protein